MSITAISRDWGIDPSIVRIVDDTTLAAITTTGYLATQLANIELINNGAFQWLDTDYILVSYSNGEGFFTRDAATDSLVAAAVVPGSLSNTLASGSIFVGSAGNVATGVALSGDATMANTGAMTIANSAITNAKLAANAVDTAKLALNTIQYAKVPMTAAQFNGMYAAPFVLVAAGGANTLIVVEQMLLEMTFVSAQYTAGGVVAAQYDSTVHGAGVAASETISAATINGYAASTSDMVDGSIASAPLATSVNKGLYLSNQTQAFATGDSTWIVHLWYRIVATV